MTGLQVTASAKHLHDISVAAPLMPTPSGPDRCMRELEARNTGAVVPRVRRRPLKISLRPWFDAKDDLSSWILVPARHQVGDLIALLVHSCTLQI